MATRVLIADDDRDFVELLSRHLEARGVEVSIAFDAGQAILGATQTLPDLILLDVKMPGRGLDALRVLKASETTSAIPVIVASWLDDPRMVEVARSLGADEFLSKRAAFDEVYSSMCRILSRSPAPARTTP